jgi:hypothetical protein
VASGGGGGGGGGAEVVVGAEGSVQVPVSVMYCVLRMKVGASWSVSVHQDVYGARAGQFMIIVIAVVVIVPVTSHAMMVVVQVVLSHFVIAVVMSLII